MEYELSYRSEENHIFIPEWENREIKKMPEYQYTLEETKDQYYYEIEIGSTWDDNFGELIVRKVKGSGKDETLEQLTEAEIEAILSYVGTVCFE